VLGQKFDLDSLTHNTPEIVIAARMAPTHLSDNEVIQLLNSIDGLPTHPTSSSLSETSSAAIRWLDDHFDPKWEDFDEGYAAANWLRKRSDAKDDRQFDVEKLLEAWGVAVVAREFAMSLDAVAVWGPTHGPAIVINVNGMHSRSSRGRRATLAHEICHLLLDRNSALPVLEVLGGRVARGIEARAGAFGAELLLPRS